MLANAFRRTLEQMPSPAFTRIVLFSVILAAAILLGLAIALVPVIQSLHLVEIEWLDTALSALAGLAFLVVAYFIFPGVASGLMGMFFLEKITDRVEDRYYPEEKSVRDVPIPLGIMLGARMLGKMLLFNVIAIPLYILVAVTGVGALVLYLVINGLLMGQEYYELVAMRHLSRREADALFKQYRGKIVLAGMAVAALFLVPIVNLAAPVLAAAFFTHVVHTLLARQV